MPGELKTLAWPATSLTRSRGSFVLAGCGWIVNSVRQCVLVNGGGERKKGGRSTPEGGGRA